MCKRNFTVMALCVCVFEKKTSRLFSHSLTFFYLISFVFTEIDLLDSIHNSFEDLCLASIAPDLHKVGIILQVQGQDPQLYQVEYPYNQENQVSVILKSMALYLVVKLKWNFYCKTALRASHGCNSCTPFPSYII
mgnify:CR=1 FL=1